MTDRPPSDDVPKLGEVLEAVSLLEVRCAPNGLDVAVSEPVIHDATSSLTGPPGAIVLGVGVPADASSALTLTSDAGRHDAAAVVLKGTPPAALTDIATSRGVALISAPEEMSWSQVHTLLRTAMTGLESAAADASGVALGDLFSLANAISAMVGGPVTIEDRHSVVLAYSSGGEIDEPRRQTILGRQVPQEWRRRLESEGVFRRLWSGEVVHYEAPASENLKPRTAVAVSAGGAILGSIWVAQGEQTFPPNTGETLREAARIAALHLIRHRASGDLERSRRGDLLRTILEGKGGSAAVAYWLGVPAHATFAVIGFEPLAADEIESAVARERTLDLVALYSEAYRHASAAVQIGRTVYVLLPTTDPRRPERLKELAADIVQRAHDSIGVRLRAGIGSVVKHVRDVPRSRAEADQVLRALASSQGAEDVADLSSALDRIALYELRDFVEDRPHLRSERLRRLRDADETEATSYIETLKAFLDAFGDIPRAAAALNVHPNTFRYRLRRLVEIAELDLEDPDQRLLISLELRLEG